MKKTIGFIRVRRRPATFRGEGLNYDIVRAVRVNGKPTHKYVLGLGIYYKDHPMSFWRDAVERMTKHGLSKAQRQHFVAACVRKGARLPTRAECKKQEQSWKKWNMWTPDDARTMRKVLALTRGQ
jgi:hypothetical protein